MAKKKQPEEKKKKVKERDEKKQKQEKHFPRAGHCVPSFCSRHESGWKRASTIFLPTTEHVLRTLQLSKSKNTTSLKNSYLA